tara:strand:+ start:358 stop:546 length:189 start_codon:yes stop_codon:yes gene_type:complete
MKNMTHKELVNTWIKAQGDMTLVPGDPRRVVDKETSRNAFTELLRRESSRGGKDRGLHGVKR